MKLTYIKGNPTIKIYKHYKFFDNDLFQVDLENGLRNLTDLTFERSMFSSYRNQAVDLLCKSTDWFLYDGNIGR